MYGNLRVVYVLHFTVLYYNIFYYCTWGHHTLYWTSRFILVSEFRRVVQVHPVHSSVLCCTVLSCSLISPEFLKVVYYVLHYTVLYYLVLYPVSQGKCTLNTIVLCTLFCAVLQYLTLHMNILVYSVMFYTVPQFQYWIWVPVRVMYAVPHCAVLYCTVILSTAPEFLRVFSLLPSNKDPGLITHPRKSSNTKIINSAEMGNIWRRKNGKISPI